jgi:hypothetical protein
MEKKGIKINRIRENLWEIPPVRRNESARKSIYFRRDVI